MIELEMRRGGNATSPPPTPLTSCDAHCCGAAAYLWRAGLDAQSINTLSTPARCTALKLKLYFRAVSHKPRSSAATRGSLDRRRLTTWTSDSLSTTNTTCLLVSNEPNSTTTATGQKNSPH